MEQLKLHIMVLYLEKNQKCSMKGLGFTLSWSYTSRKGTGIIIELTEVAPFLLLIIAMSTKSTIDLQQSFFLTHTAVKRQNM